MDGGTGRQGCSTTFEWLPEARSSRERKALLNRVRGLLAELEAALDELDSMH